MAKTHGILVLHGRFAYLVEICIIYMSESSIFIQSTKGRQTRYLNYPKADGIFQHENKTHFFF